MQRLFLTFLILTLPAWLAACGGGTSSPPAVTFVVRLQGQADTETFRIASTSPAFIAQARAQLTLPVEQRRLRVSGDLLAGHGGYNEPWHWHLSRVTLAEASIELCDGLPSQVETNLAYWLDSVKRYCPWSSYIYAEL